MSCYGQDCVICGINDLCEKIVKLLEVESGMIFNEFDLITVSKMAKKDEEAGSKCC